VIIPYFNFIHILGLAGVVVDYFVHAYSKEIVYNHYFSPCHQPAEQIENILAETVSLANTHYGGRYLFGGTQSTTAPYAYNGTSRVTFSGDNGVTQSWISPGTKIAVNIPGPEIFQKSNRGSTLFQGNTGAVSGTGSDSGTANAVLNVIHGTTTFSEAAPPVGSGVAAGTGSATGDTIIGPTGAHTLTLNINPGGATGTVALDGGTPLSFDTATAPDPANFVVTNADGDMIHLDLTAMNAAGYSGTVDITSTGSLSMDGGATTIPIDFSANQVVKNSLDSTVTNIDSTAITRTGDEYLTYLGTFDIFETLVAIRDDLKNTRELGHEDQIASISSRLDQLEDSHSNMLSSMSELGGRSLRLNMTKTRLEEFDVNLISLVANIEEADITESIMNLEMANQSLQLAQSVTSQILQSIMIQRYG